MSDRIVAENVVKRFDKGPVLRGLNWNVPAGAVVGLLGLNGSGKSTLLRCMVGLLRPDAGGIQIDGHDAWDLPTDVKARIGYVDQQARFFPWMRGRHLLAMIGSHYPQWNESFLKELSDQWQVPLDQSFGSLSPGQQHKIAILAAMGHQPDLLILDEPVSSLDPVARRDFLKSLLELSRDGAGDEASPHGRRRTILFSTHITSDIERVASHVAILIDGEIRWFDELDDLKDRVKRWRVRGHATQRMDWTIPSALNSRRDGAGLSVVMADTADGLRESIEQQHDVTIDVEDLNLEDIFMELHGREQVA